MRIQVRLFAAARQLVDQELINVECPPDATVAELREALTEQYEPLVRLVPHTRFAVDSEYVNDQYILRPDEEIAFIPPVSGG